MPERIDGSRLLIAIGALALLISLFLSWFGPGAERLGDDVSAWTALEIVDLLLAAVALTALYAVISAALPRAGVPALPAAALRIAGPLALVLVLYVLIDDPPAVRDSSPESGLWIALAASALMALGALLAVARISLVISVRDRRAAASARDREPEPEPEPPPYSPETTEAPTRRIPRERP